MPAARVLTTEQDSLTLAVSGHVSLETTAEIERLIAKTPHKQIVLDLSEVTLLDRDAAIFLGEELTRGVELINCPPYLIDWISGTRK